MLTTQHAAKANTIANGRYEYSINGHNVKIQKMVIIGGEQGTFGTSGFKGWDLIVDGEWWNRFATKTEALSAAKRNL